MRPKLLHRILLKEQVFLFLLILGTIIGLALVIKLLQMDERVFSQSLSLADTGRILFYLIPFFLFLLLPLGCMLAVFLSFLRMGSDNELLALKSGGISIYQVLATPVLLCLFCTVLHYWIAFTGLGWGMQHFYETVVDLAKKKTEIMLQPGSFNQDIPGLLLFTQKVDSRSGVMQNVFIQDRTREESSALITAAQGEIQKDEKQLEVLFILKNGRIYREEGQELSVLGFDRYILRFNLAKLMGIEQREIHKPAEMGWTQLQRTLQEERDDPLEVAEIRTEQSKRLLLPLSNLILGLLALPLAFLFQGLRRHWGIILVLLVFFTYFTLFFVGSNLSVAGVVSPVVGLWVPNLLLLIAAVLAIRTTAKERYPRVFSLLVHKFADGEDA